MQVVARITGQRKNRAEPRQVHIGADAATLGELIVAVVESEVAQFQQRQEMNQLLAVLTPHEITAGQEVGRISSSGSGLDQSVDPATATAVALEAFSDGFYFAFVDGEQIEALDDPVSVNDASTLMFVRLTPLAGG